MRGKKAREKRRKEQASKKQQEPKRQDAMVVLPTVGVGVTVHTPGGKE